MRLMFVPFIAVLAFTWSCEKNSKSSDDRPQVNSIETADPVLSPSEPEWETVPATEEASSSNVKAEGISITEALAEAKGAESDEATVEKNGSGEDSPPYDDSVEPPPQSYGHKQFVCYDALRTRDVIELPQGRHVIDYYEKENAGGDKFWWGMQCPAPFSRVSCQMTNPTGKGKDTDIRPLEQGCYSDDEEWKAEATLWMVCCGMEDSEGPLK